MEFDTDILQTFLEELMEGYRQKILEQDETKELAERERKLAEAVRIRFHGPHSKDYKLVADLTGCIFDLSNIKQEQLYIQGVKDGIRVKKWIMEIEEEK